MAESSSDDGNMSEYDFVEVEADSCASSDDGTVTSSLAPPKGWSTLSLSDADGIVEKTSATVVAVAMTDVACGRREFISSPTATAAAASAVINNNRGSTRFEPGSRSSSQHRQQQQQHACLECPMCGRILRDCVECPTHHTLFCREHLRIDSNGKSPCPCALCCASPTTTSVRAPISTATTTTPKLYPIASFLPNIPVQRMADAVPSSCEGCGTSLSWGELAFHVCDQQVVACDAAASGCAWFGQRQRLSEHASTCRVVQLRLDQEARRGKVVKDALEEAAELRTGLAAARERANTAEMRALELEVRVARAEKSLEMERAVFIAKQKELETLLQEEEKKTAAATTAAAAAAAATRRERKPAASTSSFAGGENGTCGATRSNPVPPTAFGAIFNAARFSAQPQPNKNAATGSTDTTRSTNNCNNNNKNNANSNPAHTTLITNSNSNNSNHNNNNKQPPYFVNPLAIAAAAGKKKSPTVTITAAAGTQTAAAAAAAASRATATATGTGTVTPARSSSTKGAHSTAVQMARRGGSAAASSGGGGVMTDTACQAPVPASEACLKPYLDKPKSLLDKKVVVFWPR